MPHGEQYLAAEGPLLDEHVLPMLKAWMTLDADAGDIHLLGDRLEGWSWCAAGRFRLLARLCIAGKYDTRAAYFAHGRAWEAAELDGELDPGAYLGDPAAFDAPWSAEPPRARPPLAPPSVVRFQQVAREPDLAEALLAHLYEAAVMRCPVVLSVPSGDFASGGAVAALVSFARAALPSPIKRDVTIRVYTTQPGKFLQVGADLVVVPEKAVPDALRARPGAVLLNRRGAQSNGPGASAEARSYARMVVKRALKLPEALLRYAARVRSVLPGRALPTPAEVTRARVVYNLAAARGEPPELEELLLCSLAPEAAEHDPALSLGSLVEPEEWAVTPAAALETIVLGGLDAPLSPGAEGLRSLVESVAQKRGLSFDEGFARAWKRPFTSRMWDRLAALRKAGLISDRAAAAGASSIPIASLSPAQAARVLAAEDAVGALAWRDAEQVALADLAFASLEVLDILLRATENGRFPAAWAARLARRRDLGFECAQRWIEAATRAPERFGEAVDELLDGLPRSPAAPPSLSKAILHLARRLSPVTELPRFLLLLELLSDWDHPGRGEIARRLEDAQRRATDPDFQRAFVARALAGRHSSFGLAWVVGADGTPAFPSDWIPEVADLVLANREAASRLSPGALAELAIAAGLADPAILDVLARGMDAHIEARAEEAIAALARFDLHLVWRGASPALNDPARDPAARRRAAIAWLRAPVWQESDVPGASFDVWKQVTEDARWLSTDEIRSLGTGPSQRPRWPWIAPFQDRQATDLAALACDAAALCELARVIEAKRDLGRDVKVILAEEVPDKKALSHLLPGDRLWLLHKLWTAWPPGVQVPFPAVAWLAREKAHSGAKPPALDSASLQALCEAAGALRENILDCGSAPPEEWLVALDRWLRGAFTRAEGRLDGIGDGFLRSFEGKIAGSPRRRSEAPDPRLAQALRDAGRGTLARFFSEPTPEETRPQRALSALGREGGDLDSVWCELAKAGSSRAGLDDLLDRLAESASAQEPGLDQHGLGNVERIVAQHPGLLLAGRAEKPLAAMRLALFASGLHKAETAGAIALRLVRAAPSALAFERVETWRALFAALAEPVRRDGLQFGGDHAEAAVERLHRESARWLDDRAKTALDSAHRLHVSPGRSTRRRTA